MTKDKRRITVNLDVESYKVLKQIADENERSLSGQVSFLIKSNAEQYRDYLNGKTQLHIVKGGLDDTD